MKTKLTYLFVLCLLVCIALPAVLLSNSTSAASGQLTDIQEISDRVLLLESGFDWLKWFIVICLPALLVLVTYFHSDTGKKIDKLDSRIDKLESNTRQDIQRLESRIDKLDSKLESGIQDIRILLIQNTSQQDTSKASPQARRQAKR